MKQVFMLFGALLALSATAKEAPYIEPDKLNAAQMQQAEAELVDKYVKIDQHHRDRLVYAKQVAANIVKPTGAPKAIDPSLLHHH